MAFNEQKEHVIVVLRHVEDLWVFFIQSSYKITKNFNSKLTYLRLISFLFVLLFYTILTITASLKTVPVFTFMQVLLFINLKFTSSQFIVVIHTCYPSNYGLLYIINKKKRFSAKKPSNFLKFTNLILIPKRCKSIYRSQKSPAI